MSDSPISEIAWMMLKSDDMSLTGDGVIPRIARRFDESVGCDSVRGSNCFSSDYGDRQKACQKFMRLVVLSNLAGTLLFAAYVFLIKGVR